jgi:hypothetical protein
MHNHGKLYWLAGIIDGEGTIRIVERYASSVVKRYDRYVPEISLTNTSQKMIDEILNLSKTFNFSAYIYKRKGTNRYRFDITISGVKRLQNFIPLIIDKIIAKKEQIELLDKYLHFRINNYKKEQNYIIDKEFKDKISQLNQTNGYVFLSESSTTTCEGPKLDHDIV